MTLNLKVIQRALNQVPCSDIPHAGSENRHPAAVLIPLFQLDQAWHMLFIKRAHHKADRHSGQIAFPGGRAEPADQSLLETALREAREEIGLDPGDVTILGQTCTLDTVTNYRVTPFVGIIPWPYFWQLSPLEVGAIIPVNLSWLGNPKNYRIQSWTPDPEKYPFQEVIFYNRIQGELLWGATAQMVLDFLELLPFPLKEEKR